MVIDEPALDQGPPTSLSIRAARLLATTTKTPPQMQSITSRWLLRRLPWVDVKGGSYRVNRRLTLKPGRGRVSFVQEGHDVRIVPQTLAELPALRGWTDLPVLEQLAALFTPFRVRPGQILAEQGDPVTKVYVVAHGRLERVAIGKYGVPEHHGVITDGDQIGDEAIGEDDPRWSTTLRSATAGTVMELDWAAFRRLRDASPSLREQLADFARVRAARTNRKGEADVAVRAGHEGEAVIPGTFVDYELAPREYELSLTQTVLRIHTRVADLYNEPMDQLRQQLRLTLEEVRETQEWEMVNNAEFGLLSQTAYDKRISTRTGPPTPDDMDDLLTMRRSTNAFFAHPKAIAAFFRQCNHHGLYPDSAEVDGHRIPAWRGVPIFPLSKIPVEADNTSTIIAMRMGEDRQGVIGLHQTGIPDECESSVNVRFMGIDDRAIMKYLVTAYYSAAILVPDAIGLLENVSTCAEES